MLGTRQKSIVFIITPALFLVVVALIALTRGRFLDSNNSQAVASAELPARRAARGERVALCIEARPQPVELQPVSGLADVVTEDQLTKALAAALPLWHPPTVPSLIHELKLWGCGADFTKAMVGQARSGTLMVETLTSDKLCRERTTPNGASFLLDSPFGINVVQSGTMDAVANRAEGHYGQLLFVLGEAGVPLDTPVTTAAGRHGTLADVLQDAVMRFNWTHELEFIGAALALWLPPQKTWTDQFGNRYSFDELVEHLLAVPYGQGPCGGTHVPYTVAAILNIDSRYPILTESVRRQAIEWLSDLSKKLEQTELAEGGWDKTWPGDETIKLIYNDEVLDRLTVMGHHLEWIALAPETVRPSKAVITRAVAAYVAELDQLPPMQRRSFKTILPCSHGARALCLLRGCDPYTMWLAHWKVKNSKHVPETEAVSILP